MEQLLKQFPHYDLVLMCDVLEHLNKADGATVVHWFLSRDSILFVTIPKDWFKPAALHENPDEEHKSYWAPEDFQAIWVVVYLAESRPWQSIYSF